MKTDIHLVAILCLLILSSCASKKFLPRPADMGSAPFGSYLSLVLRNRVMLGGELIAIDSSHLFILRRRNPEQRVQPVPLKEIKSYSVQVTRANNNTIPLILSTLASCTHGWFLPISLPVNLTTILVSGSGYHLSKNDIPLHELHKYARFPQGIPPGLPLEEIR